MIFGTFGKLKSQPDHPYCTGVGGGTSDNITVGKLDNNSVPWARGKSHFERFKYWTRLSDKKKWVILQQQFKAEKGNFRQRLKTWCELNKKQPGDLVVAVGNEPNLYPYIPPEMYAKFFKMWRDWIKAVNPEIRVMNGGFFVFEGYPKGVIKCLNLAGIKHTEYYKNRFYAALKAGDDPDVLNIHFYPWLVGGISKLTALIKYVQSVVAEYTIPVQITEWGNINAISQSSTNIMVSQIVKAFKSMHIEKAYYFKATGTDSKLKDFQKELKRWRSRRAVRIVLRWSRRRGFRWAARMLPKLFGFIPGREIIQVLDIIDKYSKQLPIQGLETNGKLNSTGKAYMDAIKEC